MEVKNAQQAGQGKVCPSLCDGRHSSLGYLQLVPRKHGQFFPLSISRAPFPSCSCYRYYFLLALAYRREFAYLLSLRAYLNVPICVVSGSHRFNKKGDHFPLSVTSSWLLRRSMLSEISSLTLLC